VIVHRTPLAGAWIIDNEKHEDERGFFARGWCARECEALGLRSHIVQVNFSYNRLRGTVRGMHYQAPPHAETKIVRCLTGRLYDVIIDLRPGSSTLGQWFGIELAAGNQTMLYIPEGLAHGFQTLEDDTEVLYLMSEFHTPEAARGLRYDDPAFRVSWPLSVSRISQKDLSWPSYEFTTGPIPVGARTDTDLRRTAEGGTASLPAD